MNCEGNTPNLPAIPFAWSSRWVSFAISNTLESSTQFGFELRKITLDTAIAPYQNVIVIRQAMFGKRCPKQFTKPPLHPIADNSVTDSFGDGDTVSLAQAAIRAG